MTESRLAMLGPSLYHRWAPSRLRKNALGDGCPLRVNDDVVGELPGTLGDGSEILRHDVAKLPPLGHRVQARRDDVEVGWAVVAGARVGLRRPGSLEVHARE